MSTLIRPRGGNIRPKESVSVIAAGGVILVSLSGESTAVPGEEISVGWAHDLRVVMSTKGPEGDGWVIAETTD